MKILIVVIVRITETSERFQLKIVGLISISANNWSKLENEIEDLIMVKVGP